MGGKCTCWVIHSSAWWPLTGCRAGLLRMLLPCELQAMELRPGDRRGLCAQALHLGQAGGQEIGCFIALWNWPVVFAWDGLFLGSQPLPPPGGRTPGLVYLGGLPLVAEAIVFPLGSVDLGLATALEASEDTSSLEGILGTLASTALVA